MTTHTILGLNITTKKQERNKNYNSDKTWTKNDNSDKKRTKNNNSDQTRPTFQLQRD